MFCVETQRKHMKKTTYLACVHVHKKPAQIGCKNIQHTYSKKYTEHMHKNKQVQTRQLENTCTGKQVEYVATTFKHYSQLQI